MGINSARLCRGLAVTLLVTAALATSHSPTQAQDIRIVSGTVVEMSGGRAVISTNTGPMTVDMSGNTRYEKEGPGTIADLQPNQFVAVTGQPTDGGQRALLVRVFPAVQSTVQVRANSPMDGPNLGNLMTNAIVDNVTANQLTVRTAGETVVVDVGPDTEVRRPVPATVAEVTEGARIGALGVVGGDGVLQASVVNLLGAPGGGTPAPTAAR